MMIIMQKSLKLVYTLFGAFSYFLLYFEHKFCVDCCLFALGVGLVGMDPRASLTLDSYFTTVLHPLKAVILNIFSAFALSAQ